MALRARSYGSSSTDRKVFLDLDKAVRAASSERAVDELYKARLSRHIKHAFPGIRVVRYAWTLGLMLGNVTMSAADNGIGLPGDLDVKNSGTLGLELVESWQLS
jgi:two-component sensor histidine kinase